MNWKTSIEPIESPVKFTLDSKVITMGSCFSDVLGKYLTDNKLQCSANPFGVIYNIFSLSEIIQKTINFNLESEKEMLIQRDEMWFHFDYHSKLNDIDTNNLLDNISDLSQKFKNDIIEADFFIITLGTSWVYELITSKHKVANCHKQPGSLFEKKLLDLNQQLDIFKNIYSTLKNLNTNLKIILTVSPVRHLKDTIELNSVSKSILRVLCDQVINSYEDVFYFPSFEIMMDDLRDYRFYKEDLIHPSEMAERYIINLFSDTFFNRELHLFIEKWQKIKRNLEHKPMGQAKIPTVNS